MAKAATLAGEVVVEERTVTVANRPITFHEFLDYSDEPNAELVDGVLVDRMTAFLDHERTNRWLYWLLWGYAQAKDLGEVLGSRTAVKMGEHGGRLPDLLFVAKERSEIVQERAVYGPPDLVVEVLSPSDRRSDAIAMEAGYRRLGVNEIWLGDRQRNRLRLLCKRPSGYDERELAEGEFSSEAMPGLVLRAEWLLQDKRPGEREVLESLLSSGEGSIPPETGLQP